jgi:8-oxo-dGTP pyrophosphatase MutT (NUDIX family)
MSWKLRLEPVLRPLMQAHWRRTRGMTLGVQGCAIRADGHVCLVRHTYRPGWHFPGGGVERGETLYQALVKEMREEAGIALAAPPRLVHLYSNDAKFRGDHIAFFVVEDWAACEPDPRDEIAEVIWAAPDDLPDDTSPAVHRRLAEVLYGAAPGDVW